MYTPRAHTHTHTHKQTYTHTSFDVLTLVPRDFNPCTGNLLELPGTEKRNTLNITHSHELSSGEL